MSGIDGVTGCKGCGAAIKFLRSENGKATPVNAEETTIMTSDGRIIKGHIPHHITCQKAEEFRKGKAEKPNTEGNTDQDKCKVCFSKTSYREWHPPDSEDVLEFWDCRKGCGRWWHKKGTDYSPSWKDATPEQKAKNAERKRKHEEERMPGDPF